MTVIDTEAGPVRRLEWQLAEVREIVVETPRVKSLLLRAPSWRGHLPGQHVDIRLTADDGYQAQRSYSLASPPEDELIMLMPEIYTEARCG
jgi:ferredoxin-NADP reductase